MSLRTFTGVCLFVCLSPLALAKEPTPLTKHVGIIVGGLMGNDTFEFEPGQTKDCTGNQNRNASTTPDLQSCVVENGYFRVKSDSATVTIPFNKLVYIEHPAEHPYGSMKTYSFSGPWRDESGPAVIDTVVGVTLIQDEKGEINGYYSNVRYNLRAVLAIAK